MAGSSSTVSQTSSSIVPEHLRTTTTTIHSNSLPTLSWDHLSLRYLPVDSSMNNVMRPVPNAVYARVLPTPIVNPSLVAVSPNALCLINGLPTVPPEDADEETLRTFETLLAQVFSGNLLLPGSDPVSHCYCGYQFGLFAGQLGDGAAIMLGEVNNSLTKKEKQEEEENTSLSSSRNDADRWILQLKGSGLTPFSRDADGRKVLRSSIREFLCSEHMNALGIPTTRAGCLVTSDSRVLRDIMYTGDIISERCSVVLRIARTFFRFGSFEIFTPLNPLTGAAGPSVGNVNLLISLANFMIWTLFPDLLEGKDNGFVRSSSLSEYVQHIPSENDNDNPKPISTLSPSRFPLSVYHAWYREIVRRTARLVAAWQSVGFCHGVLNTDNMSIIGDTIDYGPYGFMERFDPHFIPNSSDKLGRYAFSQQPMICRWNCLMLGNALAPVLDLSARELETVLTEEFDTIYASEYLKRMTTKLGLINTQYTDLDETLIKSLLDVMHRTSADFTTIFVLLEEISVLYDPLTRTFTIPNLDQIQNKILESLGDLEDIRRTVSRLESFT